MSSSNLLRVARLSRADIYITNVPELSQQGTRLDQETVFVTKMDPEPVTMLDQEHSDKAGPGAYKCDNAGSGACNCDMGKKANHIKCHTSSTARPTQPHHQVVEGVLQEPAVRRNAPHHRPLKLFHLFKPNFVIRIYPLISLNSITSISVHLAPFRRPFDDPPGKLIDRQNVANFFWHFRPIYIEYKYPTTPMYYALLQ